MGNLINTASVMMCPHGGTIQGIPNNTQVMAAGSPVLTALDTFIIAGCALASAPTPSPCLTVQWIQPDSKSQVTQDFTLSDSSQGLCLSGLMAPQGTVQFVVTQTQVQGQ